MAKNLSLVLRVWLMAWLVGPMIVLAWPLEAFRQDRIELSPQFQFLEDPSHALTVSDVDSPSERIRFRAVADIDSSANFGASRSAIWLRMQVRAAPGAPLDWLLEVANPALDRMDLYVSDGAGGFRHDSGGDLLPFAERVLPHRHHVKPVRLLDGQVTDIYLRVESLGTVSAPTTLWQPAALWQRDQTTYAGFGLYFGLLLGLLLYNGLLYTAVRDRAYLIYVGFVACMGLSQAANSGLGTQFLWSGSTWWANNSINVMNAASGMFGLWFATEFLAARRTMPRLGLWMQALAVLWALAIPASLLLPYRAAVLCVTLLAIIGVLTVAWAATLACLRRHPGAQYFALAWGVLLVGVLILTLHNNGLLPSNLFTSNALLIASALEMVLLSYALAYRINTARKEKEQAQAQMAAEHAAVEALRLSQARYQAVIEHVAEGMLVLIDERVVFANARAAEILEAGRDDLLANGALQHVHPDDRSGLVARLRARLAGEALPDRVEVRLQRPGRTDRWLELGDTAMTWDERQGLLIFFLDITARKQAERDTAAALARQQELNALRSRFVAMTSHEFRTPLATIQSSQDLLRHYHERLPPEERQELLTAIESSVQRMAGMLDRVLLLGKAEAQMLEFKPRPLDLTALCESLLREARRLEGAERCDLAFETGPEVPGRLFDEKLLRHILGNLLSNAIKYTPQGGTVWLRLRFDDAATLFEVQDAGIGIPQEELGHLFESFHRASNVGDIRGTGLGLAIVKNAVDLHRGTIEVISHEGRGTRFIVRLAA